MTRSRSTAFRTRRNESLVAKRRIGRKSPTKRSGGRSDDLGWHSPYLCAKDSFCEKIGAFSKENAPICFAKALMIYETRSAFSVQDQALFRKTAPVCFAKAHKIYETRSAFSVQDKDFRIRAFSRKTPLSVSQKLFYNPPCQLSERPSSIDPYQEAHPCPPTPKNAPRNCSC